MLNSLHQVGGGPDDLVRDNQVAHAMQFVDTSLQQILDCRRSFYATVVDRNQQSFDFVTQVSHSRNAGHACATFERMKVAFQLVHRLRRTFLDPFHQRLVCRLE